MTAALFLLRCLQTGISLKDQELITIGTVTDIYTEAEADINITANNTLIAQQDDFDSF